LADILNGKQHPVFSFIFGLFVSIFDAKQGLNAPKSYVRLSLNLRL